MKYTLSVVFCRLVHKDWNYIYPKWWTTRIQATQKVSFIIIFFSITYHFNARTTVKEPKSNWSSFLLWIFTSYKIIFGGERTNKNKLPVKNSGRVSSGKKWKNKASKRESHRFFGNHFMSSFSSILKWSNGFQWGHKLFTKLKKEQVS